MHTTALSIDQQLRRFVICLSMCQWCAASSRWCRGQAHVLYDVHTFLHQSPNSVVDWVSESTGLFGGHRSGEIKSGVCCWRSWTVLRAQSDVRTRHFYRSYLKANKVNKNEETRKVEHAHHFWKYAATDYQKLSKLVHACWNYNLLKLAGYFETQHSVEWLGYLVVNKLWRYVKPFR